MKNFFRIRADRNFVEKTGSVFLRDFKKKFPVNPEKSLPFGSLGVSFACGLLVLVMIGSSAVYANQKNVEAVSLFYPMKRAYEKVSLMLVAKDERPMLQLRFADRRIREIEYVSEKAPEDPQVADLMNDLQESLEESALVFDSELKKEDELKTDIVVSDNSSVSSSLPADPVSPAYDSSSLNQKTDRQNDVSSETETTEPVSADRSSRTAEVPELKSETKKETAFCESFNEFLEQDSAYLKTVWEKNPKLWKKFQSECESLMGKEKIKKEEEKKRENIKKSEETNRPEREKQEKDRKDSEDD